MVSQRKKLQITLNLMIGTTAVIHLIYPAINEDDFWVNTLKMKVKCSFFFIIHLVLQHHQPTNHNIIHLD